MRPKVIAGNWKMFKDLDESAMVIADLKKALTMIGGGPVVVVCPPFTSLALVANQVKGTSIKLGAQNISQFDEGAYTGEISWKMLKSTGCEFVIIGHSERREYFGETNVLTNLKLKKTLAAGLTPILCVGEKLDEREKGITMDVVSLQLKDALSSVSSGEVQKVIIAYEPVWAIGTGKTATPQQAQETHHQIRKLLAQLYSWPIAERLVIQYGGSVKPDNAAELLAQDDIDGALVGGACLKADSFAAIISAAKR